jgi:hypothetical protein
LYFVIYFMLLCILLLYIMLL